MMSFSKTGFAAAIVISGVALGGCVTSPGTVTSATEEAVAAQQGRLTDAAIENARRREEQAEYRRIAEARKREEERQRWQRVRRQATEDLVVGALNDLYGSCYAASSQKSEAVRAMETRLLSDEKRDYGTGGAC